MPLLTESLTLASGAVLRNRIVKAAMSEELADREKNPTEDLVRLYRTWGRGGVGGLITGHVMVDRAALSEPANVVLDEKSDLSLFRAWARAASDFDVPTFVQLNHPGRQVPRNVSARPVAPSAVPLKGMFGAFATPRALLDSEIERIVAAFGVAASLAKQAGFAGVQIHAAHGYLGTQFLSPLTNKRTDRWGGSIENRSRFLIECVRSARRGLGPDGALLVKLNTADFQRGGFDDSDLRYVVQRLGEERIGLLELSGGSYEKAAMMGAEARSSSSLAREAYFSEYAERIRATCAVPIMLTGGFRSRAAMAAAVEEGRVDVVGLARPLARNPSFPEELLAGRSDRAPSDGIATGIKSIDFGLGTVWHKQQLVRMAKGLRPRERPTFFAALMALFGAIGPGAPRLHELPGPSAG